MHWSVVVIALLIFAAFIYLILAANMNGLDDELDDTLQIDEHESMIYPELEGSLEELEEVCEESRKYRESYND